MVLVTYLSGHTSNRRTSLELQSGHSSEGVVDTCIALNRDELPIACCDEGAESTRVELTSAVVCP